MIRLVHCLNVSRSGLGCEICDQADRPRFRMCEVVRTNWNNRRIHVVLQLYSRLREAVPMHRDKPRD